MLDADFVIVVHDEILGETGGLPGLAGGGKGALESALFRINNHAEYAGLDDVLGIAAMYAEAIARGHLFNDGNKRTALTCAITYLKQQGYKVREDPVLEEMMVRLASGEFPREDFAWVLGVLSNIHQYGAD